MSGFNVVGSAPVASIPSGSSGTFYGPGVGNITLGGLSLSANVSSISAKFVVREVLAAPASARMQPRFIVREMLIATYVAPSGGGFVSIIW